MVIFLTVHPLAGSMVEFFSSFLSENLVRLLEIKLRRGWGALKLPALRFLILKLVYANPPAIHPLQCKCSYWSI